MGAIKFIVLLAVVGFVLYACGVFSPTPSIPEFTDNEWWGRGEKKSEDASVVPFKINISEETLRDLKMRLSNARLGEDLEESSFDYGFQVKYMKEVIEYWKTKYDWRKQEAILNSFPNFKTKIEGIDIHFMRVKPRQSTGTVKPLLLVHGWPGSVWEFYKIIPMLTDPGKYGLPRDMAFEVICPSIPGYGFSEGAHHKGLNSPVVARIFLKLMKRLGFEKFYYQGGDWGALIGSDLATLYPENVIGLHLNVLFSGSYSPLKNLAVSLFPSLFLSPEEQEGYPGGMAILSTGLREMGYMHIQATRPDTVAFGLNDSPVGLAAYILEKISVWTDENFRFSADGELTKKFTLDELLTNVMIYWVTGSIGSSVRFYRENLYDMNALSERAKIPTMVPAGASNFRNELIFAPKFLAKDKYSNIIHFNYFSTGGHFAAFEVPELLAGDVFEFVKKVEQLEANKANKKEL